MPLGQAARLAKLHRRHSGSNHAPPALLSAGAMSQLLHLLGSAHTDAMVKSRKEAESEVRSWGFGHVFTWTDGPYVDYASSIALPVADCRIAMRIIRRTSIAARRPILFSTAL